MSFIFSGTPCIIHSYCLAVQVGFYSDVVECWLRMLDIPGSILGWGKKCLAFFSPVTFGAQSKITHPMARSTSMLKIDL